MLSLCLICVPYLQELDYSDMDMCWNSGLCIIVFVLYNDDHSPKMSVLLNLPS